MAGKELFDPDILLVVLGHEALLAVCKAGRFRCYLKGEALCNWQRQAERAKK
jgi:hypothetical protein